MLSHRPKCFFVIHSIFFFFDTFPWFFAALKRKPRITVLTIIRDRSNIEEYRLAMETFECYCLHEGYSWVAIDISQNETLQLLCPHDQVGEDDYLRTPLHCTSAGFTVQGGFMRWGVVFQARQKAIWRRVLDIIARI